MLKTDNTRVDLTGKIKANKREGCVNMSTASKPISGQNPESYSPKDKPVIMSMAEELCSEKVIKRITIKGVEFEILEKSKSLYAGFHITAPDNTTEPDVMYTFESFKKNYRNIADSVTPNCMVAISIGYAQWDKTYKLEFMHGQETTNRNQLDEIYVFEAPKSLFIRTKATEEAWKLTKETTGEDNPKWHMAPLFGLIRALFCNAEHGYKYCNAGNHEMEYYYFDGSACVYVPVERI